jgi:hypothetical protein
MVCDLEVTTFEDQAVWRIGHAPTPWTFTDWAHADQHGRFDGRWDDPEASYRVLYASTSRFAAFVEALGDFRADPELAAGLKDIVTDDEEERAVPPGHLPVTWPRGRVVGEATVTARCAQVGHSRSLASFRRELAALVVRYQLEDLDGSAIRLRAPRAFTQHVSRFVYECTDEDGAAQFHGIHYLSRFGDDLADVALFELPTGDDPVSAGTVAPISLDDPALHDAMTHHGLAWFDDTAG